MRQSSSKNWTGFLNLTYSHRRCNSKLYLPLKVTTSASDHLPSPTYSTYHCTRYQWAVWFQDINLAWGFWTSLETPQCPRRSSVTSGNVAHVVARKLISWLRIAPSVVFHDAHIVTQRKSYIIQGEAECVKPGYRIHGLRRKCQLDTLRQLE